MVSFAKGIIYLCNLPQRNLYFLTPASTNIYVDGLLASVVMAPTSPQDQVFLFFIC